MNIIPRWKRKLKTHLLDNKYKIVEAFRLGGTVYYMFDNQLDAPAGRQMAALAVYNEMEMRCDRDYLVQHCKAMRRILSDPKKIDIQNIVRLNLFLEERLELMVLPEFIYKLASIVFFDETESPYSYDFEYCARKIKKWKEAGGTLDFFMKTPLKELIPSLNTQGVDLKMSFQIASQIDETHRRTLTSISSEKT